MCLILSSLADFKGVELIVSKTYWNPWLVTSIAGVVTLRCLSAKHMYVYILTRLGLPSPLSCGVCGVGDIYLVTMDILISRTIIAHVIIISG